MSGLMSKALQRKLASAIGSGLVGFEQAGAGAVARTAQSKMREAASVTDFGAVGDGVADDLPAFNLAAAAAVASGGSLYIPKGAYRLNGRWLVTANNLTIYGDGEASCLINTEAATNAVSTVRVDGNNNTVRDIRIDGIKATITGTLTERTGLIMAGDYPTAENVVVHDTLTAGMSIGFGRGVKVRGCIARNVGYFGGHQNALGIVVSTATQASIVNCVAYNTARTGIFAFESTRVTMSGNTVDGCENGLRLDAVAAAQDSFSVITGNVATNGTGDGIRFTGSRVTVSGNLCYANGGSGATSGGGSEQTIIGNTFFGNGQNGVRVGQESGPTTNLTITGNGCFGNTGNGVFFSAPSQAVTALVTGNNLIGNADRPLRLTASSAASTLRMSDNNWDAASVPVLQVAGWTVSRPGAAHGATASASTITLYGDGYHGISGTDDISNITILPAGNHVILYFVGTAAAGGLLDGAGNLRLAGNFAYTPNATIHLVSNGTNWLEVSRSTN